jgi:hypothetical protein
MNGSFTLSPTEISSIVMQSIEIRDIGDMGAPVGNAEGHTVGMADGKAVGVGVGKAVGIAVVGSAVGVAEGARDVGDAVGAADAQIPENIAPGPEPSP